MHADLPNPPSDDENTSGPWYKLLTRYHWFVLLVAALGWLFDTMDQRIFLISRQAALTELLGYQRGEKGALSRLDGRVLSTNEMKEARDEIAWYSTLATAIFMLGWASGGLYFGIMGDRWGRARTMLITILIYSMCTGLSALSRHWWDFTIYRFITGLGVGGEFAAGISLVAEVMPTRARPHALGLLQALSAVGNITGSLLSAVILPFGWQWMFLVGTVPALLVVAVQRTLKEPETWQKVKKEAEAEDQTQRQMGSLRELLGTPRWRWHTVIGLLLALSGVIGLWGVGFWSFELVSETLRDTPRDEVTRIRAWGTALQDVGAFFGIYAFSLIAARLGRRTAFAVSYAAALVATVMVFGFMRTQADVYWMLPILGFCNLAVFGGFAIYFPELYPTRLRSTGTGFCYNAARFLAALGPFILGSLVIFYGRENPTLLGSYGGVDSPLRYAAITVASIYVLGLLVLPFAPETRGKPLPE